MELAPSTTAEDWVVAVNEIVRLYRRTSPDPRAPEISFEDALSRLRDLGLEDGDATRWLSPRRRPKQARWHHQPSAWPTARATNS